VLTQVQWLTGSPDTARRTAEAALDSAREIEHHLSLNNVLSNRCPVYYWSGDLASCERCVSQLEDHVTRHGLVARRPVARFYRAALLHAKGDPTNDAVDALRQAIEEFRSINHLARMPYYLGVLAQALIDHGRLGEAEATIREAREVARAQGEGWCLPEVLRIEAAVLTAQGRREAAQDLLGESMALARDIGAKSWRLRAACDLARLWRDGSRTDDARRMLEPVFNEFSEGFATRDLLDAGRLLAALKR
jgi:ATP/maltotriose-dependent transcriptional regulator MalT